MQNYFSTVKILVSGKKASEDFWEDLSHKILIQASVARLIIQFYLLRQSRWTVFSRTIIERLKVVFQEALNTKLTRSSHNNAFTGKHEFRAAEFQLVVFSE
jgi:hypothetical protein